MFRSLGWQELMICGCMLLPLLAAVFVAVALVSRGKRPAAPPATSGVPAGWNPDPTGRHELRYWDGAQWTQSVSDSGAQSNDPL